MATSPSHARHASPARGQRTASPPRSRGFDFTLHMRRLCADMVTRLPQLAHIDLPRVAISFSQARKAVAHGLQATLTPMRFEDGAETTLRQGKRFGVQRLQDPEGNEYLYILSFYLPRFQNHSLLEKLVTILHELWHISPAFNGDLRRHPGRCYVHTTSEREYDEAMAHLATEWLSLDPPAEVYAFLHQTFDQLRKQHGSVYGTKIASPRLLPID